MPAKRILVIGASGSSGGTGLEADQKVIAAHGCYAMTATTALTVLRNPLEQNTIHTPSQFVEKQIDAACEHASVDVVKIGWLGPKEVIHAVADAVHRQDIKTVVLDIDVFSESSSNGRQASTTSAVFNRLYPLATIVTIIVHEVDILPDPVGLLKNVTTRTIERLIAIAKAFRDKGSKWVLVRGGAQVPLESSTLKGKEKGMTFTVLVGEGEVAVLANYYLERKNLCATDGSLASAIACNIANGMSVIQAVKRANSYVEAGIQSTLEFGRFNPFHSTCILPFAPGGFVQYLLDRDDVQPPWKEFTAHEFVRRMADGSLQIEKFKYYMVQDYLFLIQFARANALAAYKSTSLDDIGRSAQQVVSVQEEIKLHVEFCKEYGLQVEEMENQEEDQATTAYSRYVLDIGQSQDWLALQVALLPCLIGYGIIAKQLSEDANTLREGNRYWKWVETYIAEDYIQAMSRGKELVEKHAVKQSASRIEELGHIFVHATRMERGFWDMALRAGEGRG